MNWSLAIFLAAIAMAASLGIYAQWGTAAQYIALPGFVLFGAVFSRLVSAEPGAR